MASTPRTPTKSKEIQLVSRPHGVPSERDFKLEEAEISPLEQGEFLVQNEWMSVDPYMRGRMNQGDSYVEPFRIGQPLEGACIGRVVESRSEQFAPGDHVLGNFGWRVFWKSSGQGVVKVDEQLAPLQAYLGVMGLTGMTAWVGLKRIASLQPNSTVFVSAAAGAVGSVVCQIARASDCRVIGSVGKPEKAQWLKQQANIDRVINYRQTNELSKELEKLAPHGIDVYYDNVGGAHLEAAIDQMNDFGCIVACGMISTYNATEPPAAPGNLFKIVAKRLRMQGFIVRDHLEDRDAFLRDMSGWIQAEQVVWKETITEGLENAPKAFIGLFEGDNLGKSVVRIG